MSCPEALPLVSIGIPVFNGEKYLHEAIDSALSQNYADIEIIISDNASTDKTKEICEHYAKKDSRVRYVRNEKNVGALKNFTAVLNKSHGKYFTWLAHDDLLADESYIQSCVEHLSSHDETVLCCSFFHSFYDQDKSNPHPHTFDTILAKQDSLSKRLEFFRWPVLPLELVFYGVYRISALKKVSQVCYSNYAYPIMTLYILAEMALLGDIHIIPKFLRQYRCNTSSLAYIFKGSKFHDFVIEAKIKLHYLKIIKCSNLILREKMRFLRAALGSFIHIGFNSNKKDEISQLLNEIKMLQNVCNERLELINFLSDEIHKIKNERGPITG